MSRLLVDSIVSDSAATDLTLGASGDTVDITGDHISVNTIKDSGGNTIFTSNGSGTLSSLQGEFTGGPTLLTTNAETNATTSDFTSKIDSTYKLYIFKFININPATDETFFQVQFNAAGASGYDEAITSSYFGSAHKEDGSGGEVNYMTAYDQADAGGFQYLSRKTGNGADESASGTMWLFNPSNATYVKHFYSRMNNYYHDDYSMDTFVAGYINTTTAIDDVQFKMSSGNFDGTIKMYGL
jgi:hypothetical protein